MGVTCSIVMPADAFSRSICSAVCSDAAVLQDSQFALQSSQAVCVFRIDLCSCYLSRPTHTVAQCVLPGTSTCLSASLTVPRCLVSTWVHLPFLRLAQHGQGQVRSGC